MSNLTKIDNLDGTVTYLEVIGRRVRLTSNGGSVTFLSPSEIKRQVDHLESKDNLRPSSIETLIFLKKAKKYCESHGLLKTPPTIEATAKDFIAWRGRMGFNRVQAAEALGTGDNQPKRYEDGQPIPRYIALACAAIENNITAIGSTPSDP